MATQVSGSKVVSGAEHIIIVFLLLVCNFVPAHEVCKLILVSMGGCLISHAIMFPSKLNVVIGKYQMSPAMPSTLRTWSLEPLVLVTLGTGFYRSLLFIFSQA